MNNSEHLQDQDDSHHANDIDIISARQASLEIIHHVLQKKKSLDHSIEGNESFQNMHIRDKAFCRMLSTTTLRRLGQIDDIINKAADRPAATSSMLQNILRLGVTQILFMNVADHAAVDTSVRLVENAGLSKQKGFINAMLRTVTRKGSEWLDKQDETRLNTPEWLLKQWISDYGLGIAANIAKANLSEAPLDISLCNNEDMNEWIETLEATNIACNTLRRISGGSITNLEGFHEGKWWVQDAAAAIPANLFGDINGKTVIDLCAAPGGKTMQLAAQGANVIALDRSAKRLQRLEENAKRIGFEDKITVEVADASSWNSKEPIHYILLDAPCSATGTIRRNPDVLHLKSENDIQRLQITQEKILHQAFDLLAPGGILIYCTCSLQKSEGEDQISKLLQHHKNASKIAITAKEIGNIEEAITENGDARILPFHQAARGGMDGFFISRITKN